MKYVVYWEKRSPYYVSKRHIVVHLWIPQVKFFENEETMNEKLELLAKLPRLTRMIQSGCYSA